MYVFLLEEIDIFVGCERWNGKNRKIDSLQANNDKFLRCNKKKRKCVKKFYILAIL